MELGCAACGVHYLPNALCGHMSLPRTRCPWSGRPPPQALHTQQHRQNLEGRGFSISGKDIPLNLIESCLSSFFSNDPSCGSRHPPHQQFPSMKQYILYCNNLSFGYTRIRSMKFPLLDKHPGCVTRRTQGQSIWVVEPLICSRSEFSRGSDCGSLSDMFVHQT